MFPGVTSAYLSSVFHSMVLQAGAQNNPNVIEYLHNNAIEKLTEETHEKLLPLLSYENGKVEECHSRCKTTAVRRKYKKGSASVNTTIINSKCSSLNEEQCKNAVLFILNCVTGPLEKVVWTIPVIQNFIVTLLKVTMSENLSELKHATLPHVVWVEMEKRLNIDRDVMEKFWQHQLHMQLFADKPIHLNDVKVRLIE